MKDAGLTPMQEAFASCLAQGLSQAEAFRRAYPKSQSWKAKSVHERASVLASNVKVRSRSAELRAHAAAANEFTVSEHLRTLTELRDEARAVDQLSAAIKAEELRGKCAGFYTERVEHTGKDGLPIAVTAVPPEEYRRIAADVAAKT